MDPSCGCALRTAELWCVQQSGWGDACTAMMVPAGLRQRVILTHFQPMHAGELSAHSPSCNPTPLSSTSPRPPLPTISHNTGSMPTQPLGGVLSTAVKALGLAGPRALTHLETNLRVHARLWQWMDSEWHTPFPFLLPYTSLSWVDATQSAAPAHLWVHVGVDSQQHVHRLACLLGRCCDVLEVKLAVDVHQHTVSGGQFKLVRLLAVAVEDAAGRGGDDRVKRAVEQVPANSKLPAREWRSATRGRRIYLGRQETQTQLGAHVVCLSLLTVMGQSQHAERVAARCRTLGQRHSPATGAPS